jgi:hypothetical protein
VYLIVAVIPLVMIQIEMGSFLRFGFLFRVEFVFGSYKVMILKFRVAYILLNFSLYFFTLE